VYGQASEQDRGQVMGSYDADAVSRGVYGQASEERRGGSHGSPLAASSGMEDRGQGMGIGHRAAVRVCKRGRAPLHLVVVWPVRRRMQLMVSRPWSVCISGTRTSSPWSVCIYPAHAPARHGL
jgi:hypothetical protein